MVMDLAAQGGNPTPVAADGLVGAVDAALHPASTDAAGRRRPGGSSWLAMVPAAPFGFPLIAWVGGGVWVLILLMLASAYV